MKNQLFLTTATLLSFYPNTQRNYLRFLGGRKKASRNIKNVGSYQERCH